MIPTGEGGSIPDSLFRLLALIWKKYNAKLPLRTGDVSKEGLRKGV
jgi:hypothetical protein